MAYRILGKQFPIGLQDPRKNVSPLASRILESVILLAYRILESVILLTSRILEKVLSYWHAKSYARCFPLAYMIKVNRVFATFGRRFLANRTKTTTT